MTTGIIYKSYISNKQEIYMILYDHLFTVMHLNLSIETDMVGKQCRPTSDAALPNV